MQSLDFFCVNRLLMKLFYTNNLSTVEEYRQYDLRRRLASREGIVSLGVRVSRCRSLCVCACVCVCVLCVCVCPPIRGCTRVAFVSALQRIQYSERINCSPLVLRYRVNSYIRKRTEKFLRKLNVHCGFVANGFNQTAIVLR